MYVPSYMCFGWLFSFARVGELPLEVIRMKAKGVRVALSGNTPGFTLPTNIGELGDDITTLDLSNCSLTGTIVCPIIPRDQLASKFGFYLAYARTGELPLAIIRMKAKGTTVTLSGNTGFTLPVNIGELGDEITKLDLSNCSLTGALWYVPAYMFAFY